MKRRLLEAIALTGLLSANAGLVYYLYFNDKKPDKIKTPSEKVNTGYQESSKGVNEKYDVSTISTSNTDYSCLKVTNDDERAPSETTAKIYFEVK